MSPEQKAELLPLLLTLIERLTREEPEPMVRWDVLMSETESARAKERIVEQIATRKAMGRVAMQTADLPHARLIATIIGGQTGKNRENFLSGRFDYAFGVQCVLAGIELGRRVK